MAKVETRPSANFQHASLGLRKERTAAISHAALFRVPKDRIVDRGKPVL